MGALAYGLLPRDVFIGVEQLTLAASILMNRRSCGG
jgi:hypothetical protein